MHLKHAGLNIFTPGQKISILKEFFLIEKSYQCEYDTIIVQNVESGPNTGRKQAHLSANLSQKIRKIR